MNVCLYLPNITMFESQLQLTHKWLKRAKNTTIAGPGKKNKCYLELFRVAHMPTLREESAKFVADLDMDGNAIGGLICW